MKNAEYLEKRYQYLCDLCDDYVAGKSEATATWRGRTRALDARAGTEIPFVAMAREFELTQFEADVVFFALAPSLDAGFKKKLTQLHQNFALPNVDVGLAIELFSASFADKLDNRRAFLPTGRLIANHLCELNPKPGAESQLQEMTIVLPSRTTVILSAT